MVKKKYKTKKNKLKNKGKEREGKRRGYNGIFGYGAGRGFRPKFYTYEREVSKPKT